MDEEDRLTEMGEIYDRLQADAPAEEAVEAPDEGVTETAAEERARDEQGRFAKAETDETETPDEAAAEEAAPAEEDQADQHSDEEGEPAAEQGLEPPASWAASAKALWPDLDPVLQQELLKREQDWQRQDGTRAQDLQQYQTVKQALQPVEQHLALHGVQPAQYVSQLVAADQFLRQDPQNALRWIAQQYGISAPQGEPGQQPSPQHDPQLVQLRNQLSSELHALRAQQDEQLQTEINTFAADPAHPYFNEVREVMGGLIEAGTAADLQTAYDMAVHANPTTRAALAAEKSRADEEARRASAAAKATKAKSVAKGNLSRSGTAGGQTPPQYSNRVEELSDIYDQLNG